MALFIPEFNLQPLNTLAAPVTAAWYMAVNSETALLEGLSFAAEKNLPLLVLGGGSNLVLAERFEGLVLHMQTKGVWLLNESEEHVILKVAAGETWHDFVMHSLNEGFYGVENLALIPGSVGAAPIQNIGAYGVEVKDVIEEVHAIEVASRMAITFPHSACQFTYRDSFFKQAGIDRYIITHVVFRLNKQAKPNLSYPELAKQFSQFPVSSNAVADAVIKLRQTKLPAPDEIPNVGSFFKNPILNHEEFAKLQALHPSVPCYPQANGEIKIAAGWLIDQAGWKGRELGTARVHDKQALVLTNPQRDRAQAVIALANAISQDVHKRFGVLLEIEPRVYSFERRD